MTAGSSPKAPPATAACIASLNARSSPSSSSSGSRSYSILSAAISSKAIESGLPDTEVTCGGTTRPSPSPRLL